MSQWEQLFNNIKPSESTVAAFDKIPEGKYNAVIEKALINSANQYGPRVEFQFRISEGEFSKRKVWSNYNLTEQGIPYLKKDLLSLGHTVNQAEDLESALTAILESEVEVFIKYKDVKNKTTGQNKEYMQVYINGAREQLPF